MNILHRTNELDREGGFCNTGGRCEDPPAHSSDHLSNSNDSSDTSICTAPNDSNGSNSWRGPSTPNGLFDSAPSPVVSHSPAMEEIHVVLYEGPNRVPLSSPHCTTCSFLFIGLDYDDMNLASTNFSLVCVLDPPTLFTLPRLEQMWSGPISVALLAPVNESQFKMLSSRTRVAVVHSSLPKSLNYLRNIAINNTLTTHYFVIDAGTIVDSSLHSVLQSLPSSFLTPSTALILPLFFLLSSLSSSSLSSSSLSSSSLSSSSPPLKGCRENEACWAACFLSHSLSCRQFASLPRSKETIRQLVAAKKLAMRRSSHVGK